MRRIFLYVMLFACACRQPAEHGLGDKIATVDVGNDTIFNVWLADGKVAVLTEPIRAVDDSKKSLFLFDPANGAMRRVESDKIRGISEVFNDTLYLRRFDGDKSWVSVVDAPTGRRRDVTRANDETIEAFFPRKDDVLVWTATSWPPSSLSSPSCQYELKAFARTGEVRSIPVVSTNTFACGRIDIMTAAIDGVVMVSTFDSVVMKLKGDAFEVVQAGKRSDDESERIANAIFHVAATSTQTLWTMNSSRRLNSADNVTGKISTVLETAVDCSISDLATSPASSVIVYKSRCQTGNSKTNSLILLWPGHEPKTITTKPTSQLFLSEGFLYWLEVGPLVPTEGSDKTHPTYILKRLALEPPTT
jgi:hypothetical protein